MFVTTQPQRARVVEEEMLTLNIPGRTSRLASLAQLSSKTDHEEPPRRKIIPPRPVPPDTSETSHVIDLPHKWECRFKGKDPVAFFERIEELQDAYGLSAAQMVVGLPELLRGDALL